MKRSTIRKITAVITLLAMAALLLAACGSDEPAAPATGTGDVGAAHQSFRIGINTWGAGVPVLDKFGDMAQHSLEVYGMTVERVSDMHNPDEGLRNVQNFIAAGVDGLLVQSNAPPSLPLIADVAGGAEVPFAFYIFVGDDPDRDIIARNNPFFAGAVDADMVLDGYDIGHAAIRDGHRTALLIGGNHGDNNMDQRIEGFRRSFVEIGGGTILYESRNLNPGVGQQGALDMISAFPDADMIYALVGDYAIGVVAALDVLGVDIPVYSSVIDAVTAGHIRDGRVVEGNNGIFLAAGIAPALLINFMDGHPILNDEGLPPRLRTQSFLVTPDNVDAYLSVFFSDDRPVIPDSILRNLLWRYNPDVTYQDFVDLIQNGLDLNSLLAAHGLPTVD